MKDLTSDEGDRIIIRPNRWAMLLFGKIIKETCRKLVNRAYERGMMTSRLYHDLHAMIDRSLS